jgi:hypothetical protein
VTGMEAGLANAGAVLVVRPTKAASVTGTEAGLDNAGAMLGERPPKAASVAETAAGLGQGDSGKGDIGEGSVLPMCWYCVGGRTD